MPSENAENVGADLPRPIQARKIEKYVKLTAVINHRLVFVRPAGGNNEVDFARLMCDVVKSARNAETLTAMPKVGSFVLAKFGFYQRALVLKIVSVTQAVVSFIDFGNVEVLDFHEMKAMPSILKTIERFATKIRLSKIEHDLMNTNALKVLYDYLIRDTEMMIEIALEKDSNGETMASLRADKWINEQVHSSNINGITVPKTRFLTNVVINYLTEV